MNIEIVERASLFADLTGQERALLVERMHLHHFTAGEMIFSQDDQASAFFVIEHGGVRLSVGPVSLATLGAGAVFGESDVFLGRRRSVSAQATGDTSVWALSDRDLEQLISANPSIGVKLSRSFGSHIVQIESYVMDTRLSHAAAMASLNNDELRLIASRLSLQTFAAEHSLFRAGDPADGFYLIESGQVQVDRDGALVNLGPSEILGLMELLSEKVHGESAVALEETMVWAMSQADFEDIAAEMPELRADLSEGLRAPLSSADKGLATERLRALPIFADLDDEILEAAAQRLLMRYVAAGEVVYTEGSMGDALYLIDAGRVDMVSSASRRGEVLATLGPGGFFGEMALLTGKSRTTGARAAEDASLWALYRNDFDELVAQYPALGQALSQTLSERLGQASGAFVDKHLRTISLFAGLTADQLAEVADRLIPARYRRGEVIYERWSQGERLHLIEKGTVHLITGEGTVAVLSDGDFFGETAILTNEAHQESALSQTDVELWDLTRADFEDLLLKYPVLGLNLSRELSTRLYQQVGAPTAPAVAPVATTATATAQPVLAAPVAPAAPQLEPARTAVPVVTEKRGMFESLTLWYGGLTTGAKIRLIVLLLLLAWVIGIALPATVANALQTSSATTPPSAPKVAIASSASNSVAAPVAVALVNRASNSTPAPTATYTPPPTETPLPTDTPTATPTPTDTPTPTATPTDTPVPTATPTDTPVPTPTPRPIRRAPAAAAAPTATPKPQVQYSLIEMRRLNPCENRGKHNIYVQVVDANGAGVNDVWVIQAPANNAGDVLDKKRTSQKDNWVLVPKNGNVDFVMFKGAEYMVYISNDGATPASTDIARPIHANFTDEANCVDGGGGNTLFHNSFSVVFRKNW